MALSLGITNSTRQNAHEIPSLRHAEAGRLAQTEYERLLAVLESLSGDEWQQPTYCTLWNVREVTAHLAGAVAGSNSFAEFREQNMQNPYIREFDEPVDGINHYQVLTRADDSPDDLVAEFRYKGQRAVNNRQKLPWLVRKIALPMGSYGFWTIQYLMDTIYTRDQWMHRVDICAATSKEMVMTAEHDGRIVRLVLRDAWRKLRGGLGQRTLDLVLTGQAGGAFRFGEKGAPDATIEMEVIAFNLLASGRITVEEALAQATLDGDRDTSLWFLDQCEVPY